MGKKCEIMTQTTNYDFSIISHNDVLVIDIIDIGQKYQFELLSNLLCSTLDKNKKIITYEVFTITTTITQHM